MSWLKRLLGSDTSPAPVSVPPPPTWDEWVVLARSRSGYQREPAVRALGLAGDGRALPVLLERANDWVPEIRRAAQAALDGFLIDARIHDWAAALGAFTALRRAARADHAALLQRIEAFLCEPSHLEALRQDEPDMPAAAKRSLFELELRAAGDDDARHQVLRAAAGSSDVVVASEAVAQLDALQAPAHRLSLARAACSSSYVAVRTAGLRAALRTGDPSVQALVQALARDRSAGVRAIALAAITEGREALIEESRLAFEDESRSAHRRAAALDTLCALQAEGAMSLCEGSASDPAVGVRCVAYARRFAAARESARDALVEAALRDRSPRVRRIAVAQVHKGATAPSRATLLEMYQDNAESLGSLDGVATHLSPWSRFAFLLDVAGSERPEGTAAERLQRALGRWSENMDRCFVRPDADTAGALASQWRETRDGLPQATQRRVAAHLKAFGIRGT